MSRKQTSDVAKVQFLNRNRLTTWDATALAVAVVAPGMALTYNTSFSASASGGSTPLAFLIGGIGCFTVAVVMIAFTRQMAAAGYAYTFTAKSLGRQAGFMAGWLYTLAMFCFIPMPIGGLGGFTSTLIHQIFGFNLHWFVVFIVALAIIAALAIFDIRINARTLLVVGIVTVCVLMVFSFIVIGKGGVAGQDLGAFTFGHTLEGGFTGIFYGLIFGVLSYVGFETAADFGEETKNPRRSIPRATVAATVFAIVYYTVGTYAVAIGVGVNNGAAWAANPTIVASEALHFGGSSLRILVEAAAILSAFIFGQASLTAVTRTLFAMGREGALPRWFGRLHPKFKTPVNAVLSVSIAAVVLVAIIGFLWSYGNGSFTVYGLFAGIGGLAFTVVYMVSCVNGIVYFKKHLGHQYRRLIHRVLPAIGVVIFAAACYGSIYPIPTMPERIIPYTIGGWLLIGFVILVYLRHSRPERIATIGTIMAEEGREKEFEAPTAVAVDTTSLSGLTGSDMAE